MQGRVRTIPCNNGLTGTWNEKSTLRLLNGARPYLRTPARRAVHGGVFLTPPWQLRLSCWFNVVSSNLIRRLRGANLRFVNCYSIRLACGARRIVVGRASKLSYLRLARTRYSQTHQP
jgi:hypothetical protein